ncbi:helix-hairpin-helix domain-containing protein [Kitasatospora sp. LaBMicrA B282]|uniref:helix-hairpin-helix domain-containing protein n=1 Tax=Kitasatospora sp. LaBMicrA B282 TaxID=3420949 RepID=UPI003D117FB8
MTPAAPAAAEQPAAAERSAVPGLLQHPGLTELPEPPELPGPPKLPRLPDDPAEPTPSVSPTPPAPPAPPVLRTRRRVRFHPHLPERLHPLLLADRKAVLGLTVLLLLALGYAAQHFWFGRPEAVAVPVASPRPVARSLAPAAAGAAAPPTSTAAAAAPPNQPDPAPAESGGADPSPVVVDIAGRVTHPGVRTLPGGARVADALQAAGGVLPGVDTDSLNLARVLVDGEQVLVGATAPPGGGGSSPGGQRPPVSINRATLDQLDQLPGVGPVLAQHILDFRSAHGSIRSLDQLRLISGIGERKLAELKPMLTL